MSPKVWTINCGPIVFSLMLLTCVPAFGYSQDFHQPENIGSLSAAEWPTEQAQFQLNPNAMFSSSSPMLLAQKESKSEGKKPKAEAGNPRDKSSDASKKDDDDDEDEEEEEDEYDDDEDKDKAPATKGDKAPAKKKS